VWNGFSISGRRGLSLFPCLRRLDFFVIAGIAIWGSGWWFFGWDGFSGIWDSFLCFGLKLHESAGRWGEKGTCEMRMCVIRDMAMGLLQTTNR